MQINITARHIELTEAFKRYVNEKLSKLSRYSDRIEEARVIFSMERFNHISEITLTGKRFRMVATEKARRLEESFDLGMANIENQIKRLYARLKDHKVKRFFESLREISLRGKKDVKVEPRIIKTELFTAKPMSPEEAALEIEVFNQEFLVFRNSHNEKINVLYRRKDGNYGLIEP